MNRPAYEVDTTFVELTSPSGHKHWLGYGDDVPHWVDPATLQSLVEAKAVTKLEWV